MISSAVSAHSRLSSTIHDLRHNSSSCLLLTMNPDLRDESSLSNPHEVQVKHLLWEITVNFDRKRLEGTATYELERKVGNVLALDTNHLEIVAVTDQDGNKLSWKLHKSPAPHLGRQLAITLQESTASVQIAYRTTPTATACQWLPPSQTAGKKHPYLFTQCQAIHARSLLPCQDMPGVKMTYAARVIVPSWATCVLSAVLQSSNTMEGSTLYQWEQKVPISSYLLAMAVGDLERREVSPRCAIWSEPALVEAAAYEFAQTEDFLKTAEDIAGKEYVWGRYDLLCLPPSFPYGGMENVSRDDGVVFLSTRLVAHPCPALFECVLFLLSRDCADPLVSRLSQPLSRRLFSPEIAASPMSSRTRLRTLGRETSLPMQPGTTFG